MTVLQSLLELRFRMKMRLYITDVQKILRQHVHVIFVPLTVHVNCTDVRELTICIHSYCFTLSSRTVYIIK